MPNSNQETSYLDYSLVSCNLRILGAGSAAAIETIIGVPFDKYKNTTMVHPIKAASLPQKICVTLMGADYKILSANQKLMRCYSGFLPYSIYKIVNRGGKLITHPFLLEGMMQTPLYAGLAQHNKPENLKVWTSAFAGGLIGCGEVIFNPIDRLKVLCQVNNRSLVQVVKQMSSEGLRLQYTGAVATAVRNSVGTASLFAGKYFSYRLVGLSDHNNPTFLQSLSSSIVGSTCMIVSSHLPDYAKVRIQQNPLQKLGMFNTLKKVATEEGPLTLLEGLMPKLIASGIKAMFALTACDMIIAKFITRHHVEKETDKRMTKH